MYQVELGIPRTHLRGLHKCEQGTVKRSVLFHPNALTGLKEALSMETVYRVSEIPDINLWTWGNSSYKTVQHSASPHVTMKASKPRHQGVEETQSPNKPPKILESQVYQVSSTESAADTTTNPMER